MRTVDIHQAARDGFELDREFSQLSPDDRMMDSFDASYDRASPSMSKKGRRHLHWRRELVWGLGEAFPAVRAV
ncbi:MAG: hypothetical protein ACK5OC_11190 [Pirellula sp.]